MESFEKVFLPLETEILWTLEMGTKNLELEVKKNLLWMETEWLVFVLRWKSPSNMHFATTTLENCKLRDGLISY